MGLYEENLARLKVEIWEAPGEYIVTFDGKPIGGTVRREEGETIIRWLAAALRELQEGLRRHV